MPENEGVFWENAKGLRADTALSPQRVKKALNIRCHSEPVRRLVWESPG